MKKKMTGKGHTLFDTGEAITASGIWVLIAESCYEISKVLLGQGSYADVIHVSMSDYQFHGAKISILPNGQCRYSKDLLREIEADLRSHEMIKSLLDSVRRIQVTVECKDYHIPVFGEEEREKDRFELLERIRIKAGACDRIGQGYEGLRSNRLKTYTPKRSDEMLRAKAILDRHPRVKALVELLPETI